VAPETPYQVFMRRAPPPWAPSLAQRAAAGDQVMRPLLFHLNASWLHELVHEGAQCLRCLCNFDNHSTAVLIILSVPLRRGARCGTTSTTLRSSDFWHGQAHLQTR
jgi:hypothetical protein